MKDKPQKHYVLTDLPKIKYNWFNFKHGFVQIFEGIIRIISFGFLQYGYITQRHLKSFIDKQFKKKPINPNNPK